jgi:hypothetical protein
MNCSQKKIARSSNKEITMPKGIDPKAYAARITKAKKTVAAMDPATRAKIKDMYPKVTKEEVVKQALDTKKVNMKKPVPASMLKKTTEKMKSASKVKITGTASSKPQVSGSMSKSQPKTTAKSKPLTGPAAVKALQDRVSPAGVKKAEMDAKKAIAKKYPGLTKKSK